MTAVDFEVFDADNHYYEATDAFTRHLEPGFAKRTMQWAEVDGRTRLVVGGRINRFIPNPQFDPVARPGCLDDYFRGRSPADDIRGAFGQLEPISPAYRNRDARIEVLDQQRMKGCFMFPTLGVGMEEALLGDPDAAHAAFRALNRWVDDDWGLHYQDRIFSAPYLTLLDPDQALDEARWAVAGGARVVVMRAGPIMAPTGGRSPGDAVYDPMWKVLADAGVTVAYHSGEAGYGRYVVDWGESAEFEAFRRTPLYGLLTSDRAISDTIAALICHGVFDRFPALRVATIESGSEWVPAAAQEAGQGVVHDPGRLRRRPRCHAALPRVGGAVLRGRHPLAGRRPRRRPRPLRLRLAPRRGPRRPSFVRRRPRGLLRRRDPPHHARQRRGAQPPARLRPALPQCPR